MPTLRPNTVDSHRISFHWPLISLTLFNARSPPPNPPADFPRSTAIGSEDIPYFHIYFLLSIFRFNFWSHVTYQLCWCSSGCPLESRLPGCPRLLPGRADRSYATENDDACKLTNILNSAEDPSDSNGFQRQSSDKVHNEDCLII